MPRVVAGFALALLVLSSVAFWPLYLSKDWSAIDPYTHVHAVFGTSWLLVLVAQPLLMLRGYRRTHRVVGRTSMLVALGFVVSGVLLAHHRVSRLGADAYAQEGIYVYLPLAVAALFAVACALGYRWRRSPAVHARFMVSTAILLVDPLVARLMFFHLPRLPSDHLYQGITFTAIAAAMIVLARTLPAPVRGRVAYRNYAIGAIAVLALFFIVPYTRAWRDGVDGFRALPLT